MLFQPKKDESISLLLLAHILNVAFSSVFKALIEQLLRKNETLCYTLEVVPGSMDALVYAGT